MISLDLLPFYDFFPLGKTDSENTTLNKSYFLFVQDIVKLYFFCDSDIKRDIYLQLVRSLLYPCSPLRKMFSVDILSRVFISQISTNSENGSASIVNTKKWAVEWLNLIMVFSMTYEVAEVLSLVFHRVTTSFSFQDQQDIVRVIDSTMKSEESKFRLCRWIRFDVIPLSDSHIDYSIDLLQTLLETKSDALLFPIECLENMVRYRQSTTKIKRIFQLSSDILKRYQNNSDIVKSILKLLSRLCHHMHQDIFYEYLDLLLKCVQNLEDKMVFSVCLNILSLALIDNKSLKNPEKMYEIVKIVFNFLFIHAFPSQRADETNTHWSLRLIASHTALIFSIVSDVPVWSVFEEWVVNCWVSYAKRDLKFNSLNKKQREELCCSIQSEPHSKEKNFFFYMEEKIRITSLPENGFESTKGSLLEQVKCNNNHI
jgi:hypothetical protein